MTHRRAALAALTTLVMVASPCTAARADEGNPTLAERQAAQNRVTLAARTVDSLQARAEHAVEFYNGRLTLARTASAAGRAAEAAARTARAAYATTQRAADQAQADSAEATATAAVAALLRTQAQTDADTAQHTLDTMASGAFRTEGQLGMVSQLMLADDPLELANGRNLMNQVAEYQQRIIVTLRDARDHALQAARRAGAAQTRAVRSAARAEAASATAHRARSDADAANHTAAQAAQSAHRALDDAHRAKAHARALVARAELVLHRAARTAAGLERAAAAARRAAAAVPSGPAPSDAAATAVHWAFEQVGVPYSWGGGDESGPTRGFAQGADIVGYDCSGLTLFVYAKARIHLDHYTGSQWNQGLRIRDRKDLLPGDLMFFAYDTSNASTIHHVSVYLGRGRMIEAPYTGAVVQVSSAARDDFIGATRPWA